MASGTPVGPALAPAPTPARSHADLRSMGRQLLPTAGMMAFVAMALVLACGPGLTWSRAALITALTALALLAVGVSLFWAMGLRHEPLAIRLLILVPLALTMAITVALMLDAHFRGPGLGRALG